jgi:hypothetical protein
MQILGTTSLISRLVILYTGVVLPLLLSWKSVFSENPTQTRSTPLPHLLLRVQGGGEKRGHVVANHFREGPSWDVPLLYPAPRPV